MTKDASGAPHSGIRSTSPLSKEVVPAPMKPERCPRCDSPDPARHPAMQFEGEVQICSHPWHGAATPAVGMREALEFYADPFAWKKKNDPEDVVRIPDFYSETSFGDTAIEALAALQSVQPPGEGVREAALASAAQDFVDKVERGEARSKQSYAAFKAALALPPVSGDGRK